MEQISMRLFSPIFRNSKDVQKIRPNPAKVAVKLLRSSVKRRRMNWKSKNGTNNADKSHTEESILLQVLLLLKIALPLGERRGVDIDNV